MKVMPDNRAKALFEKTRIQSFAFANWRIAIAPKTKLLQSKTYKAQMSESAMVIERNMENELNTNIHSHGSRIGHILVITNLNENFWRETRVWSVSAHVIDESSFVRFIFDALNESGRSDFNLGENAMSFCFSTFDFHMIYAQ